jgi:hypothetical protein
VRRRPVNSSMGILETKSAVSQLLKLQQTTKPFEYQITKVGKYDVEVREYWAANCTLTSQGCVYFVLYMPQNARISRYPADSMWACEPGRMGYFKSVWWAGGVHEQCGECQLTIRRKPTKFSTSPPHTPSVTYLPSMDCKILGLTSQRS